MGVSFTLTGDAKLLKTFGNLSAVAKREKVELALMAGALPIQNDAKRRAPVLTGTLRRSIHTEEVDPDGGIAAVAVGTSIKGQNPQVPYDKRIEFGFVGTDALGRHYHQPARPYLRPALTENVDTAMREIHAAMSALIQAAAA